MAKSLIVSVICIVLFAAVLSHPTISNNNEDKRNVVQSEKQAFLAVNEEGDPEFIVMGEDVGRSGLTNFLNFSSYLEGRDPNSTQISFVPLIAVLASMNKG